MVKIATVVLVALASVADARPPPPDERELEPPDDDEPGDDEPGFNLLGFSFAAGGVPVRGGTASAFALGIAVEHPVFTKTRVFGSYDWLWLNRRDTRAMSEAVPRPEQHASGHRALLGLRREMMGKKLGRSVRIFLDGEIGGGLALANDNLDGVQVLPTGFTGVRFGYDIYSDEDDSPSRTFEIDFALRSIVMPDGIGFMAGAGLSWGN